MISRFIKIYVLLILIGISQIKPTNSYYSAVTSIADNHVATGCWIAPSIPNLIYPQNDTHAGLSSDWNLHPYMDWSDSTTQCPLPTTLQYQYESYSDPTLIHLRYRSGWLSNSTIPAPNTPEGSYYWRAHARDSWGNTSGFSPVWLLVVDRTAPIITDVVHLIATPDVSNDIKSVITWNTNENATDNLEYKTDSTDPWIQISPEDSSADNTSHSKEITGLLSNTTYYYQVKSKDMAGNESASSTYTFTTGNLDVIPSESDIVINEFLPDPTGNDDASKPNGEWVELYNRGTNTHDLTGWSLGTTSNPTYRLLLNSVNSSSLSVAPGGFTVVYRNGDTLFDMNNTGDTIQLHDAADTVIDEYSYTIFQIAENKSIARFPDGSDTWFDPIPTPGEPNILEILLSTDSLQSIISPTPAHAIAPKPALDLIFINNKKAIALKVTNIENFNLLSYELIYNSYGIDKGAIGNDVDISDKKVFEKEIDLATCSSGVCTYDQNVSNISLKVILRDTEGKETELHQNL